MTGGTTPDPVCHQNGLSACPGCGVPVPAGQGRSCLGLADGPVAPLIGRAAIARMGKDCCGKPQGCENPTDQCLYKVHPFKRHLYGEGL